MFAQQKLENRLARATQLSEDRSRGLEANLPGAKVSPLAAELMRESFLRRGDGIKLTAETALLSAVADVLTHLELVLRTPANKRIPLLNDGYIETSRGTVNNALRCTPAEHPARQHVQGFLNATGEFHHAVGAVGSLPAASSHFDKAKSHAQKLLTAIRESAEFTAAV